MPPLHHQVVTATVETGDAKARLVEAQRRLEAALESLDGDVAVTLAWGLPYFRRFVPRPAERHLPVDLRASGPEGPPVRALLDTRRFPSDPADTILEENDLAVLFRGDERRAVERAAEDLFAELDDVLRVTSIRKGFLGGGFAGEQSLPKRMAMAAGVPGADLIPDTAQLFLGFTSTQKAGLGPAGIANLETLGYTDAAGGYFAGGTSMHLSHVFEDLEAWYLNFDFRERIDTTFQPGLEVEEGVQTVPQGPDDVVTAAEVEREYRRQGRIGHSGAIQSTSRLSEDTVGTDGTIYKQGTAIPQRADFNTLDNPFFWSSQPGTRPHGRRARGRRPLRRLQPDERRLPPQPARDGRRPPGRHEAAVPAARPRPGPELDPPDDPPAELPRPAAPAPLVPARRAAPVKPAAGARLHSHG